MKSHNVLPLYFLFFERSPRRSPNETRSKFTICTEVTQIWEFGDPSFTTMRPKTAYFYFRIVLRRGDFSANIFGLKLRYKQTENGFNGEGWRTFLQNFMNFGPQRITITAWGERERGGIRLQLTRVTMSSVYRVSEKKTSTHIIGYKLKNSCLILIIFDIKTPHITWHRMTA